MMDVPGLVEQYDEIHPLLVEGHRRTIAHRDHKGIANAQSHAHLRRDARPPIRLIREEGLPKGANRVVYTTLIFLLPR